MKRRILVDPDDVPDYNTNGKIARSWLIENLGRSDLKALEELLEAVMLWHVSSGDARKKQIPVIVRHHALLKDTFEVPEIPSKVYRGVKIAGTISQRPRYELAPNAKFPYSSWTPSKAEAKRFSLGGGAFGAPLRSDQTGLVLTTKGNVLLSRSKLLLWPMPKWLDLVFVSSYQGKAHYVGEREWVVKLTSNLPVLVKVVREHA